MLLISHVAATFLHNHDNVKCVFIINKTQKHAGEDGHGVEVGVSQNINNTCCLDTPVTVLHNISNTLYFDTPFTSYIYSEN